MIRNLICGRYVEKQVAVKDARFRGETQFRQEIKIYDSIPLIYIICKKSL